MINKVILEGNVTDDCILYQKNDISYCKFSIAYNEKFKDKKRSHFFNCISFGQTAKFMTEYIKKGDLISLIGVLNHDRWETDEGKKMSSISIKAQSVYILKKKNPDNIPTNDQLSNAPDYDFNVDDIPF